MTVMWWNSVNELLILMLMMRLVWAENSRGTSQMGQQKVGWIGSLFLRNGLKIGKAIPSLY